MLIFFWTMKIINQEILRRVQLKKAYLLAPADIRKEKIGYFAHISSHIIIKHALEGVKRSEQYNELDTALYKNYIYRYLSRRRRYINTDYEHN